MESSSEEELEEDFPGHEWITPQSSIRAAYQSQTEKGIRKICSELLELKDAIENLCANKQSKYLAFLRISEEVVEAEQELVELEKHVSAQGILVQDLMSGVCRELEIWQKYSKEEPTAGQELQAELNEILCGDLRDSNISFLDKVDILLAEHKIEEALLALDAEEKKNMVSDHPGKESSAVEICAYKTALLKRKSILEDQLVKYSEQPSLSITELRKSLSSLIKLGKGALAHQLLLKAYGSRLQRNIEAFLPSCSIYTETYSANLSQLVFSAISMASKQSSSLFGDVPMNTNRIVQWAEYEIETFARLVKENSPLPETACALRSACICIQTSLSHCSYLESQGLKFSKLLLILLCPYVEEVIDMNFRRVRRKVLDFARNDDTLLLSSQVGSPCSAVVAPNTMLTSSGKKFMSIINDFLDQITPMVIFHFGGTILDKFLQLFDRYVEALINVLPGPSEDDNLLEIKEPIEYKAESDAQQIALIGTAYTVADDLLPSAVSKFFDIQAEKRGISRSDGLGPGSIYTVEYKEWKRHLQHSLDKLRDHFCRQYVLSFIYLEGKARLDGRMYLEGKRDDLCWDSDPLPSLPFQALFGRLQQLASVAGDVLLGKEKIQKVLLSRLTETVIMWLSDEQEFWDIFDDESLQLQPSGLQQLILDMHFIVEIAICGRYPYRAVQQLVSAIITRAIGAFSARGIDPQSALPEDEWFLDTAKAAINKLMLGTSGSESSELEEHVPVNDEISDSDETSLAPSMLGSEDSFASAKNDDLESPVYFTDPES